MMFTGFFLYAIVAGLIVPKTDLFPASILNYESFYSAVHIPVQIFRSLCAVLITFGILKILRASRQFSSIRLKAVQQVFIAVMLPAFIVVVFVSYMIADSLIRVSGKQHEKLAVLAAENVKFFLAHIEEKVKHKILFYLLNTSVRNRDMLSFIVKENEDIDGISIADRKRGTVIRVEQDVSSSVIVYESTVGEAEFRNLLAGLAEHTSDSVFSLRFNGARAVMSVYLGKGIIEVILNSDKLYEVISSVYGEKGWHALVMDDRGDIVMPPGGTPLGEEDALAHRTVSRGIYGKTIIERGKYYNGFEGNIYPNKWAVITEIPRTEIVSPIFRLFKGLLLGILGVYLAVIAVALVFAEKVTKPINLIARKVKLIGEGDLEQKLRIQTGDELQILSEEVEKMAVQLQEKKRMEERIGQTEKMASLGRITAGVSHEINNPLSVIIWTCQILLRKLRPDAEQYDDLKTMEKQALTCKKIVSELLQFSRFNRHPNLVAVDVNINIKETVALVGALFSKEKISIITELDPAAPKIMGDPDRLHQVFLNLAMNAADAMKKDGGTLSIRTGVFDSGPQGIVEVVFTDTGCGISREDIGRVFDPFFTTKGVGEGTGLGLSVSYGIVKDHNGEIWLESAEGKGSTFHVVLPALIGNGNRTQAIGDRKG
jgi:signal transduction histidine kinase